MNCFNENTNIILDRYEFSMPLIITCMNIIIRMIIGIMELFFLFVCGFVPYR